MLSLPLLARPGHWAATKSCHSRPGSARYIMPLAPTLHDTADTSLDCSYWYPRPNQQHPLLPLRPRNHRIDQHRLDRSPQHHCRPPHRRHKLQLRPQHRLHPVETPAQRSSAACSLLTWQIRACDQCFCNALRDRLGDGFVLPRHYSDGCGEHELVVGNVWRSGGHCLCGLWGEGQEALH
jgi:hypothetical protein